jgi:hypothetical protein
MKRPLSYDTAESLALFVDDNEEPIESPAEYAARFQITYPNFPSQVLTQWFYDHRQAIHQNSWLSFGALQFSLVELTLAEVFRPCFSANPIIDQYRAHFQDKNTSRRMSRLSEYFCQNGTWPVPPIALANPDSTIQSPWGMKCDAPYHLLEGHHRFAVLHAYKAKSFLIPTHKIWLAELHE